MKKIFTLLSLMAASPILFGQVSLLCDFEGTKLVAFRDYNGTLDSMAINATTNAVNSSSLCAKYMRDDEAYDNIKVYAKGKFADISPFAQSNTTSKLSMKVMSTMAIGSQIHIQLGTRTNQSYPGGIHSEYHATTSKKGEWETITFNHYLTTASGTLGGFNLPGSIDKMIILFNPNNTKRDTIWFDDLMGPAVESMTTGLSERENTAFKVSQNVPNPASNVASIQLDLNNPGHVNISIYDMVGKTVAVPVNTELTSGSHTFNVNVENLPNGVYFYTVKKGDISQTMRMVVSK